MTASAMLDVDKGYELTQTGIRFQRALTPHEYEQLGRRLGAFSTRINWALGDWLLAGLSIEDIGDRYQLAMQVTGRTYETLRAYEQVSISFSHDERDRAPWSFYREALRLRGNQRLEAVQLAEANRWTRFELAEYIGGRTPADIDTAASATSQRRPGAGRRPTEVTCPHCGKPFELRNADTRPIESVATWGGQS